MKMIQVGCLILLSNVGFLECSVVLIVCIGSERIIVQLGKVCTVDM